MRIYVCVKISIILIFLMIALMSFVVFIVFVLFKVFSQCSQMITTWVTTRHKQGCSKLSRWLTLTPPPPQKGLHYSDSIFKKIRTKRHQLCGLALSPQIRISDWVKFLKLVKNTYVETQQKPFTYIKRPSDGSIRVTLQGFKIALRILNVKTFSNAMRLSYVLWHPWSNCPNFLQNSIAIKFQNDLGD